MPRLTDAKTLGTLTKRFRDRSFTAAEAAKALGATPQAARRHLESLHEAGKVGRIYDYDEAKSPPVGRYSYWILTKVLTS